MNDQRIKNYVDDIFRSVTPSAKVSEQKEELVVNITERVQDYMREGLSFDAAFDTAKNTLGDISELTAPFEKTVPAYDFGSQRPPSSPSPSSYAGDYGEPRHGARLKLSLGNYGLTVLAPFVYVLVGLMSNWFFNFLPDFMNVNWWAWGWVIIPGSAILCTPMKWTTKFVSLSPFIYVLLGFWFGFWAFGWIIIPIAGLLEAGIIKVTRE